MPALLAIVCSWQALFSIYAEVAEYVIDAEYVIFAESVDRRICISLNMMVGESVIAEYVDRRICTSLNMTVGEYVIAEYDSRWIPKIVAEYVIAENVIAECGSHGHQNELGIAN